jgi:DNA repair protein RecO (recombination protein O)
VPTFRAKGIIIKKNEVREADKIFTIVTDNLGKIRAYGRSTGKINSKLGGHLDLFTNSNLILARGKSMPTLVYANSIDNFKNIKSNLTKTGIAFYASELLDNFLMEDYKDTRIYRLLYYFFITLNVSNIENLVQIRILFWSFELKLLNLLGLLPEIGNCVKCGKSIVKDNNYFDFTSGGFICSDCGNDSKSYSCQMSKEIINFMSKICKGDAQALFNLNIGNKEGLMIKEIIDKYIMYLMNKRIKSSEFLEKINFLEKQFGI